MTSEQRLAGMRIFLSASVPKARSGWENARLDLNVDEAVISLTRNQAEPRSSASSSVRNAKS